MDRPDGGRRSTPAAGRAHPVGRRDRRRRYRRGGDDFFTLRDLVQQVLPTWSAASGAVPVRGPHRRRRVAVGGDRSRRTRPRSPRHGPGRCCAPTGSSDHVVADAAGSPIRLAEDQRIAGRVGYMTAFVEAAEVPLDQLHPQHRHRRRNPVRLRHPPDLRPRRGLRHPHVHGRSGVPVPRRVLRPDSPFPGALLTAMDEEVRPFAQPARPPGRPYDFQWHGLMGYNDGGVRVVGAHPAGRLLLQPRLQRGGVPALRLRRAARGPPPRRRAVRPSIFDPR